MELNEARAYYKHIVAWGKYIHADSQYFIDQYLKEAITHSAPEDAVFRKPDGSWAVYSDVTNKVTRRNLEHILHPERVVQIEEKMQPLMPGVTYHRKYILCKDTGEKWKTVKEAASHLNCSVDYLNDCIRLGNKCKGMLFERVVE